MLPARRTRSSTPLSVWSSWRWRSSSSSSYSIRLSALNKAHALFKGSRPSGRFFFALLSPPAQNGRPRAAGGPVAGRPAERHGRGQRPPRRVRPPAALGRAFWLSGLVVVGTKKNRPWGRLLVSRKL